MRVFAAVVSFGLLAFAACGNDYDSDDPAKSPDAGTKVDASSSSSSGGTLPFDGGGGPFAETENLPCDARTADDAVSVYVLASGVDVAACGTREAPCKTVQIGISTAYATGKPKVLIGAGAYLEAITLDGGLTLEGAWDVNGSTWTANCSAMHTTLATIQAPDSANTSVKATRGASVLRFLTFKSKAAVAPGESLYGLVAIGPDVKVAIDDSELVVAAGGKGADGAPGTATGALDCESSTSGGDGAVGEVGKSSAGSLNGDGFTPAAGGDGGTGLAGHPGAKADPPVAVLYSFCDPTASCTLNPKGAQIGSAGTRGCGGGGGQGGKGGAGGGSSIGILATNALIVTYGGKITTGAGGAGGNGGNGADGVAGGIGKAGDPMAYVQAPSGGCPPNVPGCGNTPASAPGGAAGGNGGKGGNGGQGGGGAGGWSIGFSKIGNTALLASTTTVFVNGGPGKGGAPNGPEGFGQQQWP